MLFQVVLVTACMVSNVSMTGKKGEKGVWGKFKDLWKDEE